ncbi:molecular chaperone DnaJ [Nocardioides terrisoli]|uniref:molecular chaperone DnaJ n=1 Tax=Nocardioides terrisoli TaxID=3388267 RepID=UPI00287B69FC|nr:molecular chaperone DnaJ [Nocardioides marmorisolisilvae]
MNNADWANKDFYKVLGVAKDADAATIKKAYRKLARANHPDGHPGDTAAEERFKEVAEAYDVLGDAAKRKQYDEMRSMFASGGFPGGFPGGFGGPSTGSGTGAGRPGGQGFDIGDLFGDLFGGRGGGFGGRARAPRPSRGADLETETTLSFTDAIDGTTIALRLSSDAPCPTCSGTGGKPGTRPHICPECEGSGMVVSSVGGAFSMNETCPVCHGRQLVYDEACPTCHGSGRGTSDRTIQARIPAGVKDGQRIRLKGKGAAGDQGGPNGDLFVTVRVRPHKLFGRKGDSLTLDVPVSFDEAALGAEIKVPTLGGSPVTLRVPPGTPNGRVMRVRGRGVPRRDGTRGDLLVTIDVQVPATLGDDARAAVEAYRAANHGVDPRAGLVS